MGISAGGNFIGSASLLADGIISGTKLETEGQPLHFIYNATPASNTTSTNSPHVIAGATTTITRYILFKSQNAAGYAFIGIGNVASGLTITSNKSINNVANATDEDDSTYADIPSAADGYMRIDFGSVAKRCISAKIYSSTMANAKLQISDDAVTWTDIQNPLAAQNCTYIGEHTCRYFQVIAQTGDTILRVYEIVAFVDGTYYYGAGSQSLKMCNYSHATETKLFVGGDEDSGTFYWDIIIDTSEVYDSKII